jgi:hypothetical protein
MAETPGLGFELGISPVSSSSTGAPYFLDQPQFSFGGVDFGGSETTPITALVRDLAVGVAVAMIAKYLWKYVK